MAPNGDMQQGQILQENFTSNIGGTNLVDSVFKIQTTQAAGGLNFDYILTGGIRKRLGAALINAVANSQTNCLGFGLYAPVSGATKSVMRAAGTALQLFDTTAVTFTALSGDTSGASTTPFNPTNSQDVLFTQFSNGSSDILWAVGGGATIPIGAYSTTKFTTNGVANPTGTFTLAINTHNSGSWTAAGQYWYALVYRKRSTQALGNAALDITGTTVNTDDTVTLTFAAAPDTTLYDQIWIYRSARSGVTGFTTGNLIAQVASTATTFVDKGDIGNPDILTSQNIPRSGNTVLDNTPLPVQTYSTIALWGHRLAVSSGNSLYISEVNKSESYPLTNYITVPSAGPITGLAVISYTSPQANSLQELLVVFKERELWVLTPGASNNYTSWTLMKIDNTGCPYQSLIVTAQGFICWIDFRGVHIWDGTSKPIYASRLIEPLFGTNGDLDKAKLNLGVGAFFRRENQIVWYLSSKTYGQQKFVIKMDVRLTLLQIEQSLTGRTIDGTFIQDTYPFPVQAAMSYIPLNSSNEQLILGDTSGFCYFSSNSTADGANGIAFSYLTPPLPCGNPNIYKQFHKVIVWVQDFGNWNLELDYWSSYQTNSSYMTSQVQPITTETQSQGGVWDVATFDVAEWDNYSSALIPLVFNLQSGSANSTQGTALQLQFKNTNANEPITIHGFSVFYSVLGGVT